MRVSSIRDAHPFDRMSDEDWLEARRVIENAIDSALDEALERAAQEVTRFDTSDDPALLDAQVRIRELALSGESGT